MKAHCEADDRMKQALRANKRDEQKVINVALSEIRDEVRSKDWDVKAAAVLKLTYVSNLKRIVPESPIY